MSYNKCIFMGNLTRDPELKYLQSGNAVAAIGLAVNHVYLVEGKKHEEVTYLDLEAWGKTAENITKYLAKGQAAIFECRVKQESWEDKQTGQKRSKLKFVVEKMSFLPGQRKEGGEQQERRQPQNSRGSQRQQPQQEENLDGDDLPY